MLVLLGYGICLELALVAAVPLFALSIACLLTDEVSLQLGPLVRIVVVRSSQPSIEARDAERIKPRNQVGTPRWAGKETK